MKKLGVSLLALSLLLGLLPQTAMASEITNSELDLTAYLSEISTIRGYNVSGEDIDLYLYMVDKEKADFATVEELKNYLGDVIKADLSNLESIYSKYSLDQTTLSQKLSEYGEELDDYIFLNELDTSLAFYADIEVFEREDDFDVKLAAYLADVSAVRGFDVTEEDINSYLSEYAMSIDDFETVTDLSDYLGEVVREDLSNLDYFKTNYDMDEATLLQLIADNGKNINDFVFIGELEYLVWTNSEEAYPELDLSMYKDILSQLGLTEGELQNLENHFLSIEDYISSPEGQAQMEDLSSRMLTFAQNLIVNATNDENYKMSDEEIAEFASLYEELLKAVKLNVVFSITKDGIETQYSMNELMKMDEIKDADYKIAFYNEDSELLADMVITSEFIDSYLDQAIEDVSDTMGTGTNNGSVQTVKGGVLPKTSANYIPKALFGLFVIIAGILIFRKVRDDKGEMLKKQI